MVADDGVKDKTVADSPVSVLKDEDTCKEELAFKLEEEVSFDPENEDAIHIPENMAKEEEILMRARAKEEEEQLNKLKEVPIWNDTQFTKLDELLTQTQLYSEFLLEKMDNITTTTVMGDEKKSSKENKKGRGSKRKATTSYNNNKATKELLLPCSLDLKKMFLLKMQPLLRKRDLRKSRRNLCPC